MNQPDASMTRIHPLDNVAVDLENGHKYAVRDIRQGEEVIKYGFPIGVATRDITAGEHVHTHNLKSQIAPHMEYTYHPADQFHPAETAVPTINAYVRPDGRIGIRNDIWIIPTVGCVDQIAEKIAEATGALAFPHPYGCSQLGDDHSYTQKTLCGLIRHPNAGGVLVLGLGCENNQISELKKMLEQSIDETVVADLSRVRFLNAQDVGDEIEEGIRLVCELQEKAKEDRREKVPVSRLVIGLKCGGSDGLSGITANPMVGRITDYFTKMGASCVLTEVPEMFGAEQILMDRCISEPIFQKAVSLINDFKAYYISHGQPVGENPSPGNKAGGITTLEEKSLGCVQKGGSAPVADVLALGEPVRKSGLNLLWGPGNDIVSTTNLTAAGCHLILFTTGRGTPLGAPVPTLKIATNTVLAEKKRSWIDFDAQVGSDEELVRLIMETADGKSAKNEINGCRQIAIFKDGVTL
ncbi:MAG: altronate dehydratase [Firmicutes bacterium]|nr:altronate dehydratase [Bacillota bacterium]